MYVPKHFEETRPEELARIIRAHPLGMLVTSGAGGLDANHIPFEFDPAVGSHGVLTAHVARANPVWQECPTGSKVLVVFRGAEAYISPNWYPSKHETHRLVPTWNYVVAHAYGSLRVIEDPTWLRSHLEELTHHKESGFPEPWTMADAPKDYIERLLAGIVGLEIEISRIEGKWKVSQNQPEGNRDGVVAGLCGLGRADAAALIRRD